MNAFLPRVATVLVLALSAGACVVIPHAVEADLDRVDAVTASDDLRATLGPRRLLEDVTKRIRKNSRDVTVVDGVAFRDAAWPDGGWWLADLDFSRDMPGGMSQVQYLVLLGPAEFDRETGGNGAGIDGVAVAGTVELSSRMEALVFDLRTGRPAALLTADARGRRSGAAVVVVAAWTEPMTRAGAIDGIARAIIGEVLSGLPAQPVRIALMAAESGAEPFRVPELAGP